MGSLPVNVCLVSEWFYPCLVGPVERFRRYAPGFRQRGIHLSVVTIQLPGTKSEEEVEGIPVRRIPLEADEEHRMIQFVREVLATLARNREPPHVLQFFSAKPRLAPHLCLARSRGMPTLFVHTMMRVQDDPTVSFRSFRSRADNLLSFIAFNLMVTSSSIMRDRLIKYGISPRHIEVIPNGVDLQRFRPATSETERAEVRQKLGLAAHNEIVLFVGTVMQRKGVDYLAQAWPEIAQCCPTAVLVLVGYCGGKQPLRVSGYSEETESFGRQIRSMMNASGAAERVVFTGLVPNVEDYMRAADIFVFPSRREGMPNVVPEAMATGLPCVLTPFDGLAAEFGVPGSEYRKVPFDAHALADAVCDLLKNKDQAATLGKAAHRWVVERLDVELALDRFAEVYRRLAATGRNRRSIG